MTAAILQTAFGELPLPKEHIPRADWAAYVRCAKAAAQAAWERGLEYAPLAYTEAQAMPEFQPVRTITSDGWVTHP